MAPWPNHLGGVAAGRRPEFIEMMQVGLSRKSGSTRLVGRQAAASITKHHLL
jgi:hypothetical protein